jgi:two-component system sensor histidine kinase EvgS
MVNSNAEDLAQLMRLLARQDLPGLADLAHRVKGGALMIRAQRLIAACEALESACRGGDRSLLAAAVDDVRQAMEHLTERLEAYVAGELAPAGARSGPRGSSHG